MSIIDRNEYEVLYLEKRLSNARKEYAVQMSQNRDITNLLLKLKLSREEDYLTDEAIETLLFEKLLLLTDSDPEGSFSKGLLISLIHLHWPNLIKKGYLEEV